MFRPGTEIALGGGALSELNWVDFENILDVFHFGDVITNVTVNIKEFIKHPGFAYRLRNCKLKKAVYGIGVSYGSSEIEKENFLT